MVITGTGTSNEVLAYRPLGVNYARCIGGTTFIAAGYRTNGFQGVAAFLDGSTRQVYIAINANGNIEIRRGATTVNSSTLIATSTEVLIDGSTHYIAWDITFHGTSGIVKIWIDNVLSSLNLTGVNTGNSGNNYFNAFAPHIHAK